MAPSLLPAQSLPVDTPMSPTTVCDNCSMELEKEMPSTLSSSADPKDTRAYEHNRQRVKKAAERVLTKARKERGWTMCKGTAAAPKCSCCHLDKGKRLGSKEVKALVDGDVVGDAAFLNTHRRSRSDSGGALVPISFQGFTAAATRDVKLTDLVTTGKPKKRREGDFEVVPHIRSVIVLDDFCSDEKDVEEPWEHVHGDDDEKANIPSYAEIVTIAK